jgi:hypothetical protein
MCSARVLTVQDDTDTIVGNQHTSSKGITDPLFDTIATLISVSDG